MLAMANTNAPSVTVLNSVLHYNMLDVSNKWGLPHREVDWRHSRVVRKTFTNSAIPQWITMNGDKLSRTHQMSTVAGSMTDDDDDENTYAS